MRLDERTALRAYRRETKEYVFLLDGDAVTIYIVAPLMGRSEVVGYGGMQLKKANIY